MASKPKLGSSAITISISVKDENKITICHLSEHPEGLNSSGADRLH